MWIHRTLARYRKVSITLPQLSPTHTKSRIIKWVGGDTNSGTSRPPRTVEPYQVLCVIECSKDLLQQENQSSSSDQPQLMILESQEEGTVTINGDILSEGSTTSDQEQSSPWYNVGTIIGDIDDGIDDDDDDNDDPDSGNKNKRMEWTWQAYTYSSDKDLES